MKNTCMTDASAYPVYQLFITYKYEKHTHSLKILFCFAWLLCLHVAHIWLMCIAVKRHISL